MNEPALREALWKVTQENKKLKSRIQELEARHKQDVDAVISMCDRILELESEIDALKNSVAAAA